MQSIEDTSYFTAAKQESVLGRSCGHSLRESLHNATFNGMGSTICKWHCYIMNSIVMNLFFRKRPEPKVEDSHRDIHDDQPSNPYTEARLLVGHTDSVNQIAKLDEKRPVFVN
ncbi:hypothetical protein EMCRGX_G021727 [Ephydatia muelleri]